MTGDLGEHLDVIPLTDFSYVDAILQQHTRPTVSEPTLFRSEVAVRDFPKTVQSALRRRKERRRRGRKRRVRTREGESGFNADNLLGCWPRNWCLAGTKSETLLALAGGLVRSTTPVGWPLCNGFSRTCSATQISPPKLPPAVVRPENEPTFTVTMNMRLDTIEF